MKYAIFAGALVLALIVLRVRKSRSRRRMQELAQTEREAAELARAARGKWSVDCSRPSSAGEAGYWCGSEFTQWTAGEMAVIDELQRGKSFAVHEVSGDE